MQLNLRREASAIACVTLLTAGLLANSPADKPAQDVSVTVDYQAPSVVSKLEIGVTHTHAMWESGHPDAVARVKKRLEEARIRYQNQHIMGWGANNPEPSDGVYSWSSLDHRLDLIRSMANTIPVITFCTAPGWMKTSEKDWNMEDRVADEHVQSFADLCRAVALRYPDVEYFQIWNEFKGYWTKGGRDVVRFTVMYNAVYDAVKAARPEAKIGGPYLSMGGRELSANDRQVMDYWRQHSRGADFFTFDGWLEGWPPGGKTEDWMMGRTRFFADLVKEFQTMIERPVWISEFYGGRSNNPPFTAANHASCYYHALQSGARLALLWDGVGLGQLFTRTGTAEGGQPTPHYFVVQAFNQHFGPGTQLYQTGSSSDDIEVLASRAKTMLINKRPGAVRVRLEGKDLSLEGYEVRVLDTPGVESALPDVRVVQLPEGALVPDVMMDARGVLHLVYGLGDDAWYVRSADNGRTFSSPVQVNTEGKVTLKMGERGPKLALGKGELIHVVWADQWSPGVQVYPRYSRSLDGGKTFEPPRALASLTGIDGLTVAADSEGNVIAFFHQVSPPQQEIPQAHRLYLARSTDDGSTFGPEERLKIQGMDDLACSMCMMRARITTDGNVCLALRVANDNIRDFFLLRSPKRENDFAPLRVNEDRWELKTCPMCGPELTLDPAGRILCAFMSRHHVYWSALDDGRFTLHVPTPAEEDNEIYPAAFGDGKGHVLLVWQVGPMAVGRTATVKWSLYGDDGQFTGRQGALGVSTSGTKPTAFVGTDGAFYVVTTAK